MVCTRQEWLSGRAAGITQSTRGEGRVCRKPADQSGSCVSLQESSVPEELLVTVVKPGLPTVADLHVLLPLPPPTRKRSLPSDKVPVATRPRAPCPHRLVAVTASMECLARQHTAALPRHSPMGDGPLSPTASPSGTHVASKVTVVGGGGPPPQGHAHHLLSHFL